MRRFANYAHAIRAHDRRQSMTPLRHRELGAWGFLLATASIGALVAIAVGVLLIRIGPMFGQLIEAIAR